MLNLKIKGIFIVLAFSVIASVNANAYSIDKQFEGELVKICEAIKSDNKMRLNSTIRNAGLNYRDVSKGLVCNGLDPVNFALSVDASNTADLIARRTGKQIGVLAANR